MTLRRNNRFLNWRRTIQVSIIVLAILVWIMTRSRAPHSIEGALQYSGRPIGEFHCVPKTPGPHPAVIMLHGAALRGTSDEQFRTMCAMLADHGYYGEFLEYYDAAENSDSTVDAPGNFEAWFAAIHAGIDALAKNPAVDPKRIALVGFSQGAYLATGCGAMFPNQVAAVVEYYGGLIPSMRMRLKQMPPTLILHGRRDTIIPVSEATDFDKYLTAAGRPHEMHIYPLAGHGFNFLGNGALYSSVVAEDSWNRSLKFLDRTFQASAAR